jgi:hypothetical protein
MGPQGKKTLFDRAVIGKMVTAINTAVEETALELTDWETDFVESIEDQLDQGKQMFTEPQFESLDRIYHKALDPYGRTRTMEDTEDEYHGNCY